MAKREEPVFESRLLPYLLLAPQLAITAVFFLWPAGKALQQSVLRQDPFGLKSQFVGAANFVHVLGDPRYLDAVWLTLWTSLAVVVLAMAIGLVLAAAVDGIGRGGSQYETMLLVPYAVAPAIAGVLWFFLLNPSIGLIARGLQMLGYPWDYTLHGGDALGLVIAAAAWKQIPYNFLFFVAALRSIPKSLIEGAALDGAWPRQRFFYIVLPLISPTTFFLTVVNVIYAIFDTFGTIHATTQGGPGSATTTLIYKVYNDGFVGLDLGSSSAQSVILMVIVTVLTVIQFKYVEKKVTY
ncbi:MAG: sn-glycerol-3-phosphate ABC transporter permease UgpA [Proteobacteria bacterium]|nr:sn-glycerol-3-phosphate ABC transporter permease UgpA [Pseudomonadota bacterium]